MRWTTALAPLAALALSAAASPTLDRRAAFTLANGQQAQALNAKFQGLSASSACTAGENACVNGAFAQCVNGQFVMTPCSGGTVCVALPLVNSAGTSITCDTEADAVARIADTGATGGLTGGSSGKAAASKPASTPNSSAANSGSGGVRASSGSSAPSSSQSAGSSFKLQNGLDAQKLNAEFATLTSSSSCTAGQAACVKGAFAQCVGGAFVTMPCSAGLTCVALPLVNSAGTSITCDTEADALARIAATGATGGLSG